MLKTIKKLFIPLFIFCLVSSSYATAPGQHADPFFVPLIGNTYLDLTTTQTVTGSKTFSSIHTTGPWVDLTTAATGSGTSGSPWAGFESTINNAVSGTRFYAPAGFYKVVALISIPTNVTIRGDGWGTIIQKGYNGVICDIGEGASLQDLVLDGQGATYTGQICTLSTGNAHQHIRHVKAFNGADCSFFFQTQAGSQSYFEDVLAYQYNAASGSGLYAICFSATNEAAAYPRTFVAVYSNGSPAFNFGGANDVLIYGGWFADLAYTTNTKGVQIVGARIGNQTTLTIQGSNNSIIGSDISPVMTIGSGSTNITLGPGSWDTTTYTDSSTNANNKIFFDMVSYTPTWTSTGTAPVLGNGTLTGLFQRNGATLTATVNFTAGSTTTFGTGSLQFGLPQQKINADVPECGSSVINHAGTQYTGTVQIGGNLQYVQIIRDTSGAITGTSPATLASGDTIRFTCSYNL